MSDDFNLDEFENNEEQEITVKDRFNNVLSYIPFLNIWILLTEKAGTKKMNKKYNRQWITLFLIYLSLFFIITVLNFRIAFLLTMIYFWVVIFFSAKAYNGIYFEVGFIEKIISQFQPKNNQKK